MMASASLARANGPAPAARRAGGRTSSPVACPALSRPSQASQAEAPGTWAAVAPVLKRVLATAVLVPSVAFGVFGTNAAAAARKQTAPAVPAVVAEAPATLQSIIAKPEAKVAAGVAAALVLFALVRAGSSGPAAPAKAPPAPKPRLPAVASTAPISEEDAKDIVNTIIVLEDCRLDESCSDSVEQLNERTKGVFTRVMREHSALSQDGALLSAHPSIAKLISTVAAAASTKPVYSIMYEHQAVLTEATTDVSGFLADLKAPYPDLHTVLSSASPQAAVAVLCAVGVWVVTHDMS